MVFVDHALIEIHRDPPPKANGVQAPIIQSASPSPASNPAQSGAVHGPTPGTAPNPVFQKLPEQDYRLHLWATSRPDFMSASRANTEAIPGCMSEADATKQKQTVALGNKPLVVIGAGDVPSEIATAHAKLQTDLLSLSQNSRQVVAKKSGHYIPIEQPEVVISAIQQVVLAAQNHTTLPSTD